MPKITNKSIKSYIDPTWCPGCGNFGILKALQDSLVELELLEEDVVIVYSVGCCGNMADFNRIYGIHSLHGRGIANGLGAKMANHKLKVIIVAGDGDTYGEGLNHFIAACRGNHDVTVIVHNNHIYSLTTGQSSPTTPKGMRTKSTPQGLIEKPFNPIVTAIENHATFVARSYCSKTDYLKSIFKKAIMHEGVSIVDTLQPCVTFNKKMGYQFLNERCEEITAKHDASDKEEAIELAKTKDKFPIGIVYQDQDSVPYHAQMDHLNDKPLISHWNGKRDISPLIKEML